MGSLFERANQLGVLSVGRNPRWSRQDVTTVVPPPSSGGVNVRDAVNTLVFMTGAASATVNIWAKVGGSGADQPEDWALIEEDISIGERGLIKRFNTAGFTRLYVEVTQESGTLEVTIGPAGLE